LKYGLGIDTGGTCTDAVLFDMGLETVVASAKAGTTHEDLGIGIREALDGLPPDLLRKVDLVSLSTTLATNACVEGKGCRAKLVLIGCDRAVAERYGGEYGLPDVADIIFVKGGHDQQGYAGTGPDWDFLREETVKCASQADAFAIVELWGVRNPEYELKAKARITEWTGLPSVCGHELTAELNSLKRAASALLNAQLVPIISGFLTAVTESLRHRGIGAPLVIVRGDGTLMSESFARGKPVETLLCGPASSVAGALFLSGRKNCIVIDMGGTTSDISVVRDGVPGLADGGTRIGKWKTGIQSIRIDTVGLGGDSIVEYSDENGFSVGPVRAAPLSWAASRWPSVLESLERAYASKKCPDSSHTEFFYLVTDCSADAFFDAREQELVHALKDGPLSLAELAAAAHTSVVGIRLKRLEKHGMVMRCALTPTDIMHLSGDYEAWNTQAARLGAALMARRAGITPEILQSAVLETVREKLYCAIVRLLLDEGADPLSGDGGAGGLEPLVARSFRERERRDSLLVTRFSTGAVLVGIGAPVHVFLPGVAKALGAQFLVPVHAGVANAIGAITGNVTGEATAVIRPVYTAAGITGYLVFAPTGNRESESLESAVEWATGKVRELARADALARGAGEVALSVGVATNSVRLGGNYREAGSTESEPDSGFEHLVETTVFARATGKLKWLA